MKNLLLLAMLLLMKSAMATADYQDFIGAYNVVNGSNCAEIGFGRILIAESWVNNTYADNLSVKGVDSDLPILFSGINLGKIKYKARGFMGNCIKKNVTLEDGILTLQTKSCGVNIGFYKTKAEMYFENGFLILKRFSNNSRYEFACAYKKS